MELGEVAVSSKMFSIAYKKIREKGYKLKQLDIIVILEEPKIFAYKDQIIESISKITDLDKDLIGFKAKTSEKMGFIGEKRRCCLYGALQITKMKILITNDDGIDSHITRALYEKLSEET